MAELTAIVIVALGSGALLALVAVVAVRGAVRAQAQQQVLVERLAVYLKAGSVMEAKAALEPEKEQEEEEDRSSDLVNRGFEDMIAAGLDPEEPNHVAAWNATRGKGNGKTNFYAEPGSL